MPLAHHFVALLAVIILFHAVPSNAECDALPVTVNATLRGEAASGASRQDLVIEVPAAGMLSLDVSSPRNSSPRLHLERASPGCPGALPIAKTILVAESPRSWALAVQAPGSLYFALASDDPRLSLPGFKLRVAFAPEPGASIEVGDDSIFVKDVDPWEDDIVLPRPPQGAVVSFEDFLAIRYYDLCSSGELDDHGDNLLCATPLQPGKLVVAKLGNSFEDDEDFLSIAYDSTATVRVEFASPGIMDLSLLNRHGQQLDRWTYDGAGRPLAAFHSLPAGRYFLVVSQVEPGEAEYELYVTPHLP